MSNYSFETSLPAYKDNKESKKQQVEIIYEAIKNGKQTIAELADLTGLQPSTVSGRIGDLVRAGRVYSDSTVIFNGRKRKSFQIKENKNG